MPLWAFPWRGPTPTPHIVPATGWSPSNAPSSAPPALSGSSLVLGQGRPVVAAERRRGQAFFVVKVAPLRIVRPGVAHGHRPGHLRAGDNDGGAFDAGVGPDEFAVLASHGESTERP